MDQKIEEFWDSQLAQVVSVSLNEVIIHQLVDLPAIESKDY